MITDAAKTFSEAPEYIKPFSSIDLKRFWDKVQRTDTCWLWTGYKDVGGYGRFKQGKKMFCAHRVSFILSNGPIPQTLNVCHSCDNPPCVNPSHLWLGTDADNARDKTLKKRNNCQSGNAHWSKSYPELCSRGERHARAKITCKDVADIRRLLQRGIYQRTIAARFGVSQGTIAHIKAGIVWKHVPHNVA